MHRYLQKTTAIFSVKIVRNIRKVRLGEISLSKKSKINANNFVKKKNLAMIQPNPIQLTSQTPNHVEMTKILSINQQENRIIDC